MDQGVQPQRRWLQFGLRTTLLTMLLLGVGLGYWCDRAARVRKAVAALETLGVGIYWNDNAGPNGPYRMAPDAPRPVAWLGWLGPEFLLQPTSVVIPQETNLEQTAHHLKTLAALQSIYVWGDAAAATAAFHDLPEVDLLVIRRGRCGDLFVESLRKSASDP